MRLAALVAVSFALAGPALAQDQATIERLNDAFEVAFNKGDFASVASMYTEDAYLLPPGSEMAKGRNNIQAFWAEAAKPLAI